MNFSEIEELLEQTKGYKRRLMGLDEEEQHRKREEQGNY